LATAHLIVDRFVGARVRERRRELGQPQRKVAETLGLRIQQLSKCERGQISLSAGLMYEMARTLNVSLEYFFEGLEQDVRLTPSQLRLLDFVHSLREIESREHLVLVDRLVRGLIAEERRRSRRVAEEP
jgi:transcriptional regulator with XRE-family HTH domain